METHPPDVVKCYISGYPFGRGCLIPLQRVQSSYSKAHRQCDVKEDEIFNLEMMKRVILEKN